ncbi:J domain-containing protein [uncultured Pseudomonas sp.]|uniref:J domain-containing protein n=1 Tax=uncultured Pseudomonas sp. TaxID=114707 RepID=UPI0025DDE326|nr:J domain-containing protein [uncultured Pseudomonas sp.]
MQKTLTHYEQLNVARDASPEQIKQAYRKLAQRLHPDRNPAANAAELMSLVNASHSVLANPEKRARYDAELADQERRQRQAQAQGQAVAGQARQGAAVYAAAARPAQPAAQPKPQPQPRAAQARAASRPQAKGTARRRRRGLVRWALLFMTFCAAGAWMGYDRNASLSYMPTDALPAQARIKAEPPLVQAALPAAQPTPVEAECSVPALDPTGAPWPSAAGYLSGMPLLRQNGWSQIIIDNSGGDSAVYAKVTDAVGRNAYRHAYIPPGGQFSFSRMDAGYYLLKYQMLKTGCAFASSRILLEETPMGSQIKSSVYKLTLRKLQSQGVPPGRLKLDQF